MKKGVILQQGTPLQEVPIEIMDVIYKKYQEETITAELIRKIEKEVAQKILI